MRELVEKYGYLVVALVVCAILISFAGTLGNRLISVVQNIIFT